MLKRREQSICKCCGQRLLVRHGVQLSPLLADLFDMVERAAGTGITAETLAGVFYPGKSTRDGRHCVSVNMQHLNNRLAETNIEVRVEKPNRWHDVPYRIIKRKNP